MTTETSDKDFIKTFNKFSEKEHFRRYKEYFQSDPKRPRRNKIRRKEIVFFSSVNK